MNIKKSNHIKQRIRTLKIERFTVKEEVHEYAFQVNIASMNHNDKEEEFYFELKRFKRERFDAINREITVLSKIQNSIDNVSTIANSISSENSLPCEKPEDLIPVVQEEEYVDAGVPFLAKLILIQSIPNKSYRDNILGDLHEEFLQNIIDHGLLRAKIIYWSHAIRSLPWGFAWFMIKFIMKMK